MSVRRLTAACLVGASLLVASLPVLAQQAETPGTPKAPPATSTPKQAKPTEGTKWDAVSPKVVQPRNAQAKAPTSPLREAPAADTKPKDSHGCQAMQDSDA